MFSSTEIISYLGESDDEDTRQRVSDLEARLITAFENNTRRYFRESITHTDVMNGDGTVSLWLNEPPDSITTVKTRDALDSSWELVASTEYEQDGRELIRINGQVWPRGFRRLQLVYAFGYVEGTEPNDVREAILRWIAHEWRSRVVVTPADPGEAQPGANGFMPPFVSRVADQWRRLPGV